MPVPVAGSGLLHLGLTAVRVSWPHVDDSFPVCSRTQIEAYRCVSCAAVSTLTSKRGPTTLGIVLCLGLVLAAGPGRADSGFQLDLVLAEELQGPDTHWQAWIDHAVSAVESVGGQLPVPRIKVVLHAGQQGSAVSQGWVRRNSPPEIHLRVAPDACLPELLDDWHAYHEFAHLLLPFAGNRDIWFSEGMASYYQYFLQSRAGVIDADEAWRRLVAGFQRGFDDPAGQGELLTELSPRMWRQGAFRRVYWSGAAFFLRVDHRLREASDQQQSLDTTLAAFARCCIEDGSKRWTARTLVSRLGELSLPAVWDEEFARVEQSTAYPDFGAAARALGLAADRHGVRLLDDPASQQRRRALALGFPD